MILDVDLSQIEWRIAATLSHDPVMIQEICNKVDQHAATCVDMMELELNKPNRTSAKIANFRMIYANPATSWYGYYMDPIMPNFSQNKWKSIVRQFFAKYQGLAEWHDKIIHEVRINGYYTGPTGRWWSFEKEQKKGVWDYDVGQIRNYMVQGTSGDIIKLALVYIRNRLKDRYPEALMTMVVHDSIVFDLPQAIAHDVARICIDTFNEIPALCVKHFDWHLPIPIDGEADLGYSWGEMEQII